MSAPLKHDSPTGRPKRLALVVIVFLLLMSGLGFVLKPSTALPTRKDDTPQVEGASTGASANETDTDTQSAIPDEDRPTDIDEDYVAPEDIEKPDAPADDIPTVTYQVTAAVDGDTIKASVEGKTETIRLIGVDTPETKDPRKNVQCFGQQASDFTKSSLLGKNVRLEADDSQDNRDKYGRLLRYVFLGGDTNFNAKLISEGYAYEYTYRVPYAYQADFRQAQKTAESDQKGLWSPATCSGKR